jgi:hypothetical protein
LGGLSASARAVLARTPTKVGCIRVVGNIRVDQAWGLFQISGAAHHVGGSYNVLGAGGVSVAGATPLTDSVLSGHPTGKVGGR